MALLGIGSVALACPKAGAPLLLWNASPSVPVGLYRLTSQSRLTAALAVIRLPEPFRTLAEVRGYLRAGSLLIKPVVAGPGDIVCRHGSLVTINGRTVAHARTSDAAGRPLPDWNGCFRIAPTQIFVLSADSDSFDSRYIGPIDRGNVVGIALPVWVRASALTTAPAAS